MNSENYYKPEFFKKCEEFHGHVCPGLSIGYRAALYAMDILQISFSQDEEVVCVTENDACGVDAIQVILGTSVGKGNLLFHMTGKQAFSFFNRKTGKSVRLVLKSGILDGEDRDEKMSKLHTANADELFDVKEVKITLPEKAKIFKSYKCEKCGEMAAESYTRLEDGKYLCIDCFHPYSRFS